MTEYTKTYKDVYQLPLHRAEYGSWVYDAKSNFVFQFETDDNKVRNHIINVVNGAEKSALSNVRHIEGIISDDDQLLITIRGWGNLTGTGGMNLPVEDAVNIQDSFADFLVAKLNNEL